MTLNVLIVGAGICGPALALLLQRSNPRYAITVVERHANLRAAGQQIDIKNQSVDILRRMGLMDAIKKLCVDETGMELMDSRGRQVVSFGVSPAGEQRRSLTSEYEIMRGDLVQLLYDSSIQQNERLRAEHKDAGTLTYHFGTTLETLTQDEDGVDVTFLDKTKNRYDLVVGADGQGSRTRRLAFGTDDQLGATKSLGIHAAYYQIPRVDGEGGLARVYNAPENRMVITRTSNRPVTQVLLFTMSNSKLLKDFHRETSDKQKAIFTDVFRDAGWQTERLLAGLKSTDDFYATELVQIKLKQLHSGRVVLLGDAGYGPTPFTGMGTCGAIIGAYVLAGELALRGDGEKLKQSVAQALEAYDKAMQQPIQEIQKLPPVSLRLFFPSSRPGLWLLRNIAWAIAKFDRIFEGGSDDGEAKVNPKRWLLPEYAELKLLPSSA